MPGKGKNLRRGESLVKMWCHRVQSLKLPFPTEEHISVVWNFVKLGESWPDHAKYIVSVAPISLLRSQKHSLEILLLSTYLQGPRVPFFYSLLYLLICGKIWLFLVHAEPLPVGPETALMLLKTPACKIILTSIMKNCKMYNCMMQMIPASVNKKQSLKM